MRVLKIATQSGAMFQTIAFAIKRQKPSGNRMTTVRTNAITTWRDHARRYDFVRIVEVVPSNDAPVPAVRWMRNGRGFVHAASVVREG